MTNTAEIFQFPRREDVDRSEPERSGRGPQVEDGFVRIANELYQALARSRMTGNERAVVDAVIRLTYGYQRKAARITGETFANWTGMDSSDCSSIVTELVRRRILHRAGSRSPISLNKDYSQWEKPKGAQRRVKRKGSEPGEKHPTGDKGEKRPHSGEERPTEPGEKRPTYKDRKDTKPSSLRSEGESSASDELELTPPDAPKPKPSATPYPDDFEAAWSAYPKRAGGNPKKSAFKAWSARRKQGVPAATMQAGVERYAKYIRAKGDERTEFVMQAQRFFGPNAEYDNDWLPPAARTPQRQDGRMGFAQPMPVGSYGTNDLELPAWARD
ncbi:replication protein [Vreelandella aquamarina]|uniref:Bacteriophage lambda Replication protein O N-terminal domain-containing protein n=1 Tax=Vreelandella aquamarina TaxID=77097 RepID=A0A6F8SU19_9GAMM|nr:replication protein [Halomonas meridiana]BCA91914.1 hypothetical protein HMSLTHF_16890 [Halomonas meridiana]